MKPVFQHCFELLRHTDRDRYFSVLFAPEKKREGLSALYAFNAEIARIRESVREPLVGEIRLRWWRDAIAAGEVEDSDSNPVLTALLHVIQEYNLPKAAFLRYCDARIFDLYDDVFPTVHDLEAYCGETASAILQLACQILDENAALKSADACGHGGVAQAVSGIIRLFPMTQPRGQLYIPEDMVNAIGARALDFSANRASEDQKSFMTTAMIALAYEHYRQFLEQKSMLPKTLHLAFLPMAIIPGSLKKAEKAGAACFSQSANLSTFRRYCIMTKASLTGKLPR